MLIFYVPFSATSEIYTLSLHDALPIYDSVAKAHGPRDRRFRVEHAQHLRPQDIPLFGALGVDRKSTRLNSSHRCISYAVFCLKKRKLTEHTKSRKIKTQTKHV